MYGPTALMVMCAVAVTQVTGQITSPGGRDLILPEPLACSRRTRHAHAFEGGHYYFFSWRHRATSQHERDWLDARNICRKHCQDLVSLETPQETNMIQNAIDKDNVKYAWTSGRKCDFDGCDRKDLLPIDVNGWFWSGSNEKMVPTNQKRVDNYPNWSHTGGSNRPQPDNREKEEGTGEESCMGILNNFYKDGIKWHDVACHHNKPWVCEDSDELLAYARSTSRIDIP